MRHLRITHYNYSTKCCLPGRLITSCALGRYPDSAFLNCYDKYVRGWTMQFRAEGSAKVSKVFAFALFDKFG